MAVLIAIDGIAGATALAAAGLRYRLAGGPAPVGLDHSVLAVGALRHPDRHRHAADQYRQVETAASFIDPRMADVNSAMWLCLLICACGARLRFAAAARLWNRKKALSLQRPVEGA
jgi:hypothetical protein